MFYGCSSLISLNINNFNTSLVTATNKMFEGCTSLISLNLISFNTPLLIEEYINMFDDVDENLRLCYNDSTLSQGVKELLSGYINNCSNDCFMNEDNKFIIEERKCIDNCSKDDIYKFEYDNICYKTCPYRTHSISEDKYICEDVICDNYYNYNNTGCLDDIPLGYYLNNSILKTIDKCDIKCNNCSLESVLNNLYFM